LLAAPSDAQARAKVNPWRSAASPRCAVASGPPDLFANERRHRWLARRSSPRTSPPAGAGPLWRALVAKLIRSRGCCEVSRFQGRSRDREIWLFAVASGAQAGGKVNPWRAAAFASPLCDRLPPSRPVCERALSPLIGAPQLTSEKPSCRCRAALAGCRGEPEALSRLLRGLSRFHEEIGRSGVWLFAAPSGAQARAMAEPRSRAAARTRSCSSPTLPIAL
jgi:hypothetical protein